MIVAVPVDVGVGVADGDRVADGVAKPGPPGVCVLTRKVVTLGVGLRLSVSGSKLEGSGSS